MEVEGALTNMYELRMCAFSMSCCLERMPVFLCSPSLAIPTLSDLLCYVLPPIPSA